VVLQELALPLCECQYSTARAYRSPSPPATAGAPQAR
jgi:hypothetical protein